MHHPAERAIGRSYDPIRKGLEQKQDMPAVPEDEPKTFNVSQRLTLEIVTDLRVHQKTVLSCFVLVVKSSLEASSVF